MKLLFVCALATLHCPAEVLPITIYNAAQLKPDVMNSAGYLLRGIFRQSGIASQIRLGELTANEASLVLYTNRQDECRPRRDIALRILPSAPTGLPSTILALAIPFSPSGVNVTVFADRVVGAAHQVNRPVPTVLAHVIAHEIGHVLLRSVQHTQRGLMASQWTEHEYSLMAVSGLLFLPEQGREMMRTLSAHGCPPANAGELGGAQ